MRAKATRCRSGAQVSVYVLNPCTLAVGLCPSLAAYGLQVARVSRGSWPRSAPAVYLICLVAPVRLVGLALSRGPPPRSIGLTPFAFAYAPAALVRPNGAQPPTGANRGLQPRGLHYVPPGDMHRARVGLPPLRGSCGAVALIPRKGGNLPPQSILYSIGAIFIGLHLRAAYGLAACRRSAPPLKIKNKC